MKALSPRRSRQRGLTMVELLVAMTIGLVVAIAAVTTLIMGRTGFSTVDSTSQLVDRERFATDLLSRVVMQAGYEDFGANPLVTRAIAKKVGDDPEPDVFGWNNAVYAQMANLNITTSTLNADGNRTAGACGAADTSCVNGSDILVVRFQGSGTPADGSIMDCRGVSEPALGGTDLNRRAVNIFYVARDVSGEPSLYCAYYDFAAATPGWVAGTSLIEGVETMQVLYGTDSVTPNAAPPTPLVYGDSIVDRWLRADQLKVPGGTAAAHAGTRDNFRRVRAVRIGLVLRGPTGSAQQPLAANLTPLGTAYVNTANDPGSQLAVPADSRLRRVVTFTVHLRNDLSTE